MRSLERFTSSNRMRFRQVGRGRLGALQRYLSDDIGIGEVGAAFERLVLLQENVEIELAALE